MLARQHCEASQIIAKRSKQATLRIEADKVVVTTIRPSTLAADFPRSQQTLPSQMLTADIVEQLFTAPSRAMKQLSMFGKLPDFLCSRQTSSTRSSTCLYQVAYNHTVIYRRSQLQSDLSIDLVRAYKQSSPDGHLATHLRLRSRSSGSHEGICHRDTTQARNHVVTARSKTRS